jgi:subtilisin family serine protease
MLVNTRLIILGLLLLVALFFSSSATTAFAARRRHYGEVTAAEQVYQTDISTSSSQEKHYHPKRLLITLNEHPTQEQAQRSAILPEGLELKSIINNSPHGDASRAAPAPDDLIYVAHVPNGIDAADYIHTVLANARVKHVELDAYMYTHLSSSQVVKTQVNDVFYECNGNGDCATRARPMQGQQWGLEAIQAPQAWSIQKGSKAVKVGIIDTGISLGHEDLRRNVNKKCEDFVNGDHTCDEGKIKGPSKGHGTFLAGVIGATPNNSIGVAGVAWNADIIGCTMFSDHCISETCAGSTSAAIACLNWLRNSRGVRIVANSYGCSTANVNACYSPQFEKAIAAFKAQGGLFIASAGNSGTNNDKVAHYPANYNVDNVLTVAATGITKNQVFWDTRNPEYKPVFSNYGGKTVDLAAPGMDIVSTWAPASSMCQGAKSCYARISGTSAAVPFVAGTAALIASMPNAPKGKNAGVAIKSLILRHADKKAFLTGRVISGARLNAFRVIYTMARAAKMSIPFNHAPAAARKAPKKAAPKKAAPKKAAPKKATPKRATAKKGRKLIATTGAALQLLLQRQAQPARASTVRRTGGTDRIIGSSGNRGSGSSRHGPRQARSTAAAVAAQQLRHLRHPAQAPDLSALGQAAAAALRQHWSPAAARFSDGRQAAAAWLRRHAAQLSATAQRHERQRH